MSCDSLFAPLAAASTAAASVTVTVTFNNQPMQLPMAASVAAALLAAGVQRFRRSPISGSGRAPYCMMGACYECLLEIDGVPDRQACLTPLRPGMRIRAENRLPEPATDSDDQLPAMETAHGQ